MASNWNQDGKSICKFHNDNVKKYPYQLTTTDNSDADYFNCRDIPPFNALLTFFTKCRECSIEEYVEFETYDKYQLEKNTWVCNLCSYFYQKNELHRTTKTISNDNVKIETNKSDIIYFKSKDYHEDALIGISKLKICSLCQNDLAPYRILGYIEKSLENSKDIEQYAALINELVQSEIYCNGCFIINASEKLQLKSPKIENLDKICKNNDDLDQTLNSFMKLKHCVHCSENLDKEILRKHVEYLISTKTNVDEFVLIHNDLLELKLTCTKCLNLNLDQIELPICNKNIETNTQIANKDITTDETGSEKIIPSDDHTDDLSFAIQNPLSSGVSKNQIYNIY